MKVIILGCGSSGGVPLITGEWGWCNPHNPKNKRRRVSVLVQVKDLNILIDTSPDLREQLLDANINRIDGVLYTHAHADHINGIDDLRQIFVKHKQTIPVYGHELTLQTLMQMYRYLFETLDTGYPSFLKACKIEKSPFYVNDIPIISFQQHHGSIPTLGYRIGNFAYSTDMHTLPKESFDVLQGLDLWIVDALQYVPHATHAHLKRTLEYIDLLKPKRAILTHMTHFLDYDELKAQLPEGIEPGYDGLEIECAS
ncbi:MAG: MBL fold metallo-hydrolase [Proteobacteria bacterium]|nr:MBL fold metallo-hydrolase [Pseudomonadota bacterium]